MEQYENIPFKLLEEKSTEAFPQTRWNWFKSILFLKKNDIEEMDLYKPNELINHYQCYDYISKKMKVPSYKLDFNTQKIISDICYNVMFMHNWNVYKQIYKFDEELWNILINSNEQKNIPVEILSKNLPCKSFFIDNRFTVANVAYRGVYVSILDDYQEKRLGMLFVEDTPQSDFTFSILHLKNEKKTIEEIICESAKKSYQEFLNKNEFEDNDEAKRNYELFENDETQQLATKLSNMIIGCILYLCADNKEITIRKGHNKKEEYDINRQNKKGKITQFELGYKLGSQIREQKVRYIYDNNYVCEKGSKKSPHLRSGHYHHYWTGKKDGSEERKLVLHFVEPVFIGTNSEIKATVHKVVNDK